MDIVESPQSVLFVLLQGRVAGLLRPRPFLNKLSIALSSRKFCERHTTDVFPVFQKWNNQQEKGKYEEGGGKGWELTLCLIMDILWKHEHSVYTRTIL